MDMDGPTSVDLLDEIRAALDGLEPLLRGRGVDIEMSRLRVLADPMLFRQVFAELITSAVIRSQPPDSITVRVARTGKAARIEVINEGGPVAHRDLPHLASAAEEIAGHGRRDRNRRAGWRRDLLDDVAR